MPELVEVPSMAIVVLTDAPRAPAQSRAIPAIPATRKGDASWIFNNGNASPFPEIHQSRSGLLRQEEVPRKRTREREAGVGSREDGPGDGESSARGAGIIWTARAWLEIHHHRSTGDRRQ